MVTPRSKPMSFIAICPWSWYMVSTASNCPALARRNTVSEGYGPSAPMPSRFARSTAGAMMSISSRPKLPPSPACGFRPATPMRGRSNPAARIPEPVEDVEFARRVGLAEHVVDEADLVVIGGVRHAHGRLVEGREEHRVRPAGFRREERAAGIL